jgi:hypothetical protein
MGRKNRYLSKPPKNDAGNVSNTLPGACCPTENGKPPRNPSATGPTAFWTAAFIARCFGARW